VPQRSHLLRAAAGGAQKEEQEMFGVSPLLSLIQPPKAAQKKRNLNSYVYYDENVVMVYLLYQMLSRLSSAWAGL
jgi:hypothetical protein